MSDASVVEKSVEKEAERIILVSLLIAVVLLILILFSFYYAFRLSLKRTDNHLMGWLSVLALALFYVYLDLKLSPRVVASSLQIRHMAPDEFPSLMKEAEDLAEKRYVPPPKLAIMPARNPDALVFGNSMSNMTLALSEELLRGESGDPRLALEQSIDPLKYRAQLLMTFFSALPLLASMLSSTIMGGRRALAPYYASPEPVIRKMLSMADVKPGEAVYDLGSGDGRVLLVAAIEFDARSTGFELDGELVKESIDKIKALQLEDRVRVVKGDLFRADLGEADVVTLFMGVTANMKLRPKLEAELRPGTRVVSHDYEMPGWKPVKVEEVTEVDALNGSAHTHPIYLYVKK